MARLQKDIRETIVSTARDVFARYGFRKATMDEIAQAARKGKSTVYHYFRSKEEVFKAVVEKECSIMLKELTDAMNQEQTPQGRLLAYAITRMKAFNRLANFYSAFKDEYLEYYDFIQKLRKRYYKHEIETIKNILKQGVEERIFAVKHLELTAFALVTGMRGLEYHWAVEKDVSKVEKNIISLFEVLLNGLIRR